MIDIGQKEETWAAHEFTLDEFIRLWKEQRKQREKLQEYLLGSIFILCTSRNTQ